MKCEKCGKETPNELSFCTNCGAKISRSGKRFRKKRIILVLIALILIIGLSGSVYITSNQDATRSSTISIPPGVRHIVYSGDVCNSSSRAAISSTSTAWTNSTMYDSQFILGYFDTHSFLSVNVSAIPQNDRFGYGPFYLLNGLSDKNYWYQVGLGYNVPYYAPPDYNPGFEMNFEVFSAKNHTSIFPVSSKGAGGQLFSGPIYSGDQVLLSLRFDRSGFVNMSAFDWNTSSSSSVLFGSYGGGAFVGSNHPSSFFSGLMTEWYHVDQSFCSPQKVVYTNFAYPTNYAWMCLGEFKTSSFTELFSSCPYSPFYFATNSSTLQSFSFRGSTIYGDAYEFVTP